MPEQHVWIFVIGPELPASLSDDIAHAVDSTSAHDEAHLLAVIRRLRG
jgi:hypothetical protein